MAPFFFYVPSNNCDNFRFLYHSISVTESEVDLWETVRVETGRILIVSHQSSILYLIHYKNTSEKNNNWKSQHQQASKVFLCFSSEFSRFFEDSFKNISSWCGTLWDFNRILCFFLQTSKIFWGTLKLIGDSLKIIWSYEILLKFSLIY